MALLVCVLGPFPCRELAFFLELLCHLGDERIRLDLQFWAVSKQGVADLKMGH